MTIICSINYDSTVVYPGQYLTGTVGVQTLRTCLMEFIVVDVVGIASCEWTHVKPLLKCFRMYKRSTKFKGYEEFFRSRHTLVGGNKTFSLTSEPQIYRFKTFLPEYLPATWNGNFGSIQLRIILLGGCLQRFIYRYVSKIIIKEADEKFQMFPSEITVKPYRNLNLEKHLLSEILQKTNRSFRFAIINLGNVEVTVWLPLCGVAAGQSIPILCTINNNSKIFFGGIVFVLTQIEIYRSIEPTKSAKTVRKDICRVARMVHILRGKYEYYAVLETDEDTPPTNQYFRCKSCQLIYEIWVSLQGTIPRYNAYGYPNIDTSGISVIIGTHPLYNWDINEITKKVMEYINESKSTVKINGISADDEVEEILKNADEEYDEEVEWNVARQLVDATMIKAEEIVQSSSKRKK